MHTFQLAIYKAWPRSSTNITVVSQIQLVAKEEAWNQELQNRSLAPWPLGQQALTIIP